MFKLQVYLIHTRIILSPFTGTEFLCLCTAHIPAREHFHQTLNTHNVFIVQEDTLFVTIKLAK